MWTFNIQRRELNVYVRVCRWPSSGRYPVELANFVLDDSPAETELALLARAARAVELQLEAARSSEWPELPFG